MLFSGVWSQQWDAFSNEPSITYFLKSKHLLPLTHDILTFTSTLFLLKKLGLGCVIGSQFIL